MQTKESMSLSTIARTLIQRVFVTVGERVHQGQVLLQWRDEENGTFNERRNELKATVTGKVVSMCSTETILQPKEVAMVLEPECEHSIVILGLCANCGKDVTLRHFSDCNNDTKATLQMLHNVPELVVSAKVARQMGRVDEERLLNTRKLTLILDLDQTLIHATADATIDQRLRAAGKNDSSLLTSEIHRFMLPMSPLVYHMKVRPNVRAFFDAIKEKYEIHIYTMGSRAYAHTVARLLDPDGSLVAERIVSRDDCASANFKDIRRLFPCDDSMVVVLDDRSDVWSRAPNLIQIKAYHYWQGVPEINALPFDKPSPSISAAAAAAAATIAGNDPSQSASSLPPTDVEDCDNIVIQLLQAEFAAINKEENDGKVENALSSPEISAAVAEIHSADMSMEASLKFVLEALKSRQIAVALAAARVARVRWPGSAFDGADDVAVMHNLLCWAFEDDNVLSNSEDLEIDQDGGRKRRAEDDENSDSNNRAKRARLSKDASDTAGGTSNTFPPSDHDDIMLYIQRILLNAHAAYYRNVDALGGTNEAADIKTILPRLKSHVLEGVRIVFSGVIPVNLKGGISPQHHDAWRQAEEFGAECSDEFRQGHTTHVVAARIGTLKVNQGLAAPGTCVVHINWLWTSIHRWERVRETDFVLDGLDQSSAISTMVPPSKEIAATECTSKSGLSNNMSVTEIAAMDAEVDEFLGNDSDDSMSNEKGQDSGNNNRDSLAPDDIQPYSISKRILSYENGDDDDDSDFFREMDDWMEHQDDKDENDD